MMHRLKDFSELHRGPGRLGPPATLHGMAQCMKPQSPGLKFYPSRLPVQAWNVVVVGLKGTRMTESWDQKFNVAYLSTPLIPMLGESL